jgi:hypothetical protein
MEFVFVCLWDVTIDGFGLMARFIVYFDTALNYTLQFTITYTHTHTHTYIYTLVFTVRSSLPFLDSGF